MKGLFAGLMMLMFVPVASASYLVTDSYVLAIKKKCGEGHVTCDRALLVMKSKSSGNTLLMRGQTLHRMCADGITPCQFVGFRFQHAGVTYTVFEPGTLMITQANETLLEERGRWYR